MFAIWTGSSLWALVCAAQKQPPPLATMTITKTITYTPPGSESTPPPVTYQAKCDCPTHTFTEHAESCYCPISKEFFNAAAEAHYVNVHPECFTVSKTTTHTSGPCPWSSCTNRRTTTAFADIKRGSNCSRMPESCHRAISINTILTGQAGGPNFCAGAHPAPCPQRDYTMFVPGNQDGCDFTPTLVYTTTMQARLCGGQCTAKTHTRTFATPVCS